MRIFLDANILITVLCNEYPRFTACARVLSLADDPRFEVYTSPLCLAIGAYFAEKKARGKVGGRRLVRKKIGLLVGKLKLTSMGPTAVARTLADPRILDLEDGFQYHCAVEAGCRIIVTYDHRDFHFAEIPIMDAEQLLLKEVVGKGRK